MLIKLTFQIRLAVRQFAFLVCLSVFVFFLAPSVFSQPASLKFEYLTAADGLSHNKVQCILQDKQGYLWFGTVYGLNRYDGYTFRVFQNVAGDSSSIGNNNIISLYQDVNGIIWIGTSTVLCSYDPRTEIITNYNLPLLKGWIHDFVEDKKGLLWMATGSGLFSFDPVAKQVVFHRTDNGAKENIQGILKDKNDKDVFWLSTETGIRKYNTTTGNAKYFSTPNPAFEDISGEITHNIIEDSKGNIWMTTSTQGLYKLNALTGKQEIYKINMPGLSAAQSRISTSLLEDTDGKIWVGSEGLSVFDPLLGSFSFNKTGLEDNQGLPVRVRSFLKDRNGIFWIATERGVAKYDPKLYSFTTIKPDYPFTIQSANNILEDRERTFWVGNYVGLGIMNPNTGVYEERNHILANQKNILYTGVLAKDGTMWFGAESCLFHVYREGGKNNFRSEKIALPVPEKIQVRTLAFDAQQMLWIGTKGAGLLKYDPISKNFKSYPGNISDPVMLSSTTVSALQFISPDSLLIGTKGNGLILMHSSSEKFEKIKIDKREETTTTDNSIINAIYKDNAGSIWIGTENYGLWQTDTQFSAFSNYTVKNGLHSMNITQITEDDQSQIWLNTNLGLEVIDPLHKRVVYYSAKDGLSINQPAYLIKKSTGDLLRLDYNGLHIFRSSSINLNKEVPPVYINQLQILDKIIAVYKDTVIHLHHYENYLSFDYVALNYTQSFKNRYSYKMEGLDKKWIDAGERRFATYANIGPGTYTFKVKAANNNGIWNETGATVTFIIDPPWWSTWWFYTLAVLAVATIIYVLFRMRLQQELKAAEVRNTISRDLHDEVGSTLSSIGFLSSMALKDVDERNAKVHSTLNSINESSNRMLDAMNDIIWNIQPKNDTVESIIARMISFASEILEAKKINLHINIADNLNHLHLGITARHDFYMIYKEAINNLAKYSGAAEAWVSLEFKQGFLLLSIRDNGKGFDPGRIKNGNGLKNMESRAKKIGGIYHIETALGKGTIIELKVKPA